MSAVLPRAAEHRAKRPWATTIIFSLLFVAPGVLAAMITSIGGETAYAAWSLAWAMVGMVVIVFVWSRRRLMSFKLFCQALAPYSTVEVLRGLEEKDLDEDEALDLVEYLRDQRPGFASTLVDPEKRDPVGP